LTIKADESADAQAGGEAASPSGCAFIFFWGLEIVNCFLKNSDFGCVQI
jgi:hypothetical protein